MTYRQTLSLLLLLATTMFASCVQDFDQFGTSTSTSTTSAGDSGGTGGAQSLGGGGVAATGGIGGVGGMGGGPFVPTDIPGCVLWLRADLGITLNGTDVSAWADQSGAGNDFAQPLATDQPSYQPTTPALNNQPSIDFVGGTKVLTRTGGIAATLDASTYFFVYNSDSDSTANQHLIRGEPGTTGGILYAGNPSGMLGYFDGTGHRDGPADVAGNQLVALVLAVGVGGQFRRNGVDVGPTLAYDDTFSLSTTAWLGNDNGNNGDLLADLAEVVIYSAALSSAEIAQVESYLAARYAP
jgi:hypothetical protein